MQNKRSKKLYFPNLNGLRFIAAVFVIINHTEQLKAFYGLRIGVLPQSIKNIGKLGVMLFFVLSGFLITYLLLLEEQKKGFISARKFYFRRVLRIFPLYFLLIILVFFGLSFFDFWKIPRIVNPIDANYTTILILHLFFLPNLATAIYGFIPYIAQCWSIGTEEQAYLIWPQILKIGKNRIIIMFTIIVAYFLLRILFSGKFLTFPYQNILSKFWMHFNIDIIAVGSIFAIISFKRYFIYNFIVNLKTFYITLFVTITLLYLGIRVPYFHYLSYSILFGIIILNLAENKKISKILEWQPINYLGKISYGIYMYHFIVMILVLIFAAKFQIKTNFIIYPLIVIGTILLSSISYHYFESIFLKLKTKYTIITSG